MIYDLLLIYDFIIFYPVNLVFYSQKYILCFYICYTYIETEHGIAKTQFLISNFHRVLNVVCFLLGNSPVSGL